MHLLPRPLPAGTARWSSTLPQAAGRARPAGACAGLGRRRRVVDSILAGLATTACTPPSGLPRCGCRASYQRLQATQPDGPARQRTIHCLHRLHSPTACLSTPPKAGAAATTARPPSLAAWCKRTWRGRRACCWRWCRWVAVDKGEGAGCPPARCFWSSRLLQVRAGASPQHLSPARTQPATHAVQPNSPPYHCSDCGRWAWALQCRCCVAAGALPQALAGSRSAVPGWTLLTRSPPLAPNRHPPALSIVDWLACSQGTRAPLNTSIVSLNMCGRPARCAALRRSQKMRPWMLDMTAPDGTKLHGAGAHLSEAWWKVRLPRPARHALRQRSAVVESQRGQAGRLQGSLARQQRVLASLGAQLGPPADCSRCGTNAHCAPCTCGSPPRCAKACLPPVLLPVRSKLPLPLPPPPCRPWRAC